MKKYFLTAIAVVWAACAPFMAFAHSYTIKNIVIDHPWAKATLAGQTNAGGYFKLIKSIGVDDRLVSVSSNVAEHVELHTMQMQGDIMKMKEIDAIALKRDQLTKVEPGAYHLMFIGLKKPLLAGQRFPVVLNFHKAGKVTVEFEVEAVDFDSPKSSPHHH